MNRNGKKIEEVLETIVGCEELDEGYYVVNLIRDILCDHNEKEYQAEERENNIPESLHCVNCNKEFDVQAEQEAQLENEAE